MDTNLKEQFDISKAITEFYKELSNCLVSGGLHPWLHKRTVNGEVVHTENNEVIWDVDMSLEADYFNIRNFREIIGHLSNSGEYLHFRLKRNYNGIEAGLYNLVKYTEMESQYDGSITKRVIGFKTRNEGIEIGKNDFDIPAVEKNTEVPEVGDVDTNTDKENLPF